MVNLKKHTRPARSISVDSYHMRNKTDHITNGHHEKQQQIAPLDHSLNHASSLDLSPKLEQVSRLYIHYCHLRGQVVKRKCLVMLINNNLC